VSKNEVVICHVGAEKRFVIPRVEKCAAVCKCTCREMRGCLYFGVSRNVTKFFRNFACREMRGCLYFGVSRNARLFVFRRVEKCHKLFFVISRVGKCHKLFFVKPRVGKCHKTFRKKACRIWRQIQNGKVPQCVHYIGPKGPS